MGEAGRPLCRPLEQGPILGAVLFFVLRELFGDFGVWYLAGLGVIAIAFAQLLPEGLWGAIRTRTGIDLLPTSSRGRKR